MLTKILVFILVMAIIRVVMETARLVYCFVASKRFTNTNTGTALTVSSVAYIITILLCGVQ